MQLNSLRFYAGQLRSEKRWPDILFAKNNSIKSKRKDFVVAR
jgi:hypothetical protein